MHKERGTPSVAHFRLLSDAMEELCMAQSQQDVVRITGTLAHKASGVDGISVALRSGEQIHHAPNQASDPISTAHRAAMIAQISDWVLNAGETAVVPDVHRDERTSSHTNGSSFAHSLVVVPVGRQAPIAAVIASWSQEHWPSAEEVLLLEALARATALALTGTLGREASLASDQSDADSAWLQTSAHAHGLYGAERHYEVLQAAMENRVRNSLSLVRSLIRRTAETRTFAADYASHLEGRITALGRTQALVMREPEGGVDLEELVNTELLAHAVRGTHAHAGGPPVRLKARAAETLGLAFHELAANAVKFGALSIPQGVVAVTWSFEPTWDVPSVQLQWVESGVPIDLTARRPKGFGSEVLERALPYALRGASTLMFEPGGVRCTIDIPLTADNVVGHRPTPIE